MTPRIKIGIDLGGTKTEIIALDPDGEEIYRLRQDTPRDYPGSLRAIVEMIREAEVALGEQASVGVGIPGTISPDTGLVKNANSTWLIGHALDGDLAELLERPVRLMNDANCFALSEATDGAGAQAGVVFGVILGTGVGGGIVVSGTILEGGQRVAGEWGHNPLPWPGPSELPGPECYCGRRGCIETFLSGPAMQLDHEKSAGEQLSTHEIVEAWQSDSAQASATVQRYVERLGRSLATVVNVLDPDVVVLGGGMSNIPGLDQAARAALAPHVFTDQATTRVMKNVHGDSSGVRGAAWLGAV